MPQEFVASAILDAVRKLPGFPALRVLDLSCGRGEILRQLQSEGCKVRGTRYRPDDYKLVGASAAALDDADIDSNVDLMRPLSYGDGSFDVVLLAEVVEHLPTWIPVIQEAGRVLRPGGHLVLSTPNLARLHSRLHFFLSGTHKLIRRRVGWDIAADDLYAYHIAPVDFPLLHTVLHQAGLRIESLGVTRTKPRHFWLFLLYPLFWLSARMETRRRRGSGLRREGEADLFRWLVSPAMLASEQLLVTARKSP